MKTLNLRNSFQIASLGQTEPERRCPHPQQFPNVNQRVKVQSATVVGARCGWGQPRSITPWIPLLFCCAFSFFARAADKSVSFYKDVTPIFKRSCTGCHHPGK